MLEEVNYCLEQNFGLAESGDEYDCRCFTKRCVGECRDHMRSDPALLVERGEELVESPKTDSNHR